jgi:hypothetical protein
LLLIGYFEGLDAERAIAWRAADSFALLIHAIGFNLGLLMRHLIGVGTPRGLQGPLVAAMAALLVLIRFLRAPRTTRFTA